MLLNRINQRLAKLALKDLLRQQKIISNKSTKDNIITVNGRPCIDFTSNDYLGLKFHKKILESVTQGAKCYGNGSGSSTMISGYTDLQHTFEVDYAKWLGVEKAILFNSGYLANLGSITALSDHNCTILLDKLCHSSILDGVILSRAKYYRYRHCESKHLEHLANLYKPELMITESVFSMEGDIAPSAKFLKVATKYQALTIIDDAHGIGILGESGHGVLGLGRTVKPYATCVVMPLGKAFCGLGAIVAGKESIINIISQRANTYRYTTALPPGIVSGLKSALELVIDESWRRDKLHKNIKFFNSVAEEKKIILVSSFDAPIRTILVADIKKLLKIQNILIEKGFYVSAIRPPTVPEKKSRIRISVNALHSDHEIYLLLSHIATILHEK